MASFRFNFKVAGGDEERPSAADDYDQVYHNREYLRWLSQSLDQQTDEGVETTVPRRRAEEVNPTQEHYEIKYLGVDDEARLKMRAAGLKRKSPGDDDDDSVKCPYEMMLTTARCTRPSEQTCGEISLYYLPASVIEERLNKAQASTIDDPNHDIVRTAEMIASSSSDLLPGGLKVWECTEDLIKFISERLNERMRDKRVLELGCGAGLVGILCLRMNALQVHFQDYNREVLNLATIPNVMANYGVRVPKMHYRFLAGDWSKLCPLVSNAKYDFILTAETIYSPANYSSLASIFKHCLKPNGEIYVAAKSVYFGVGGTMKAFRSFCESTGDFEAATCRTNSDGIVYSQLK